MTGCTSGTDREITGHASWDSVDPHALVSDCYASFSSILCQPDCSEKRVRSTHKLDWTLENASNSFSVRDNTVD